MTSCAAESLDQAHEAKLDNNPLTSRLADDIDSDSFRAPSLSASLLSSKQKRSRPTKSRYSSFTLFDEHQAASTSVQSSLIQPSTLPSSGIRLTTSLDGSVHVKTGLSPTPSPPRLQSTLNARQPRSAAPLQRSQSAIEPPTFPRPAAPIGRSRDSRTWEFYCDSDARDELTKQADLEQSGSATGAIGLIRSRSRGSLAAAAANANPNKRNAKQHRPEYLKRYKVDGVPKASKPKLQRALSSVARLQNGIGNAIAVNNTKQSSRAKKASEPTDQEKKPSYTLTETLDGNESDKENWEPGTQNVVAPRRRPPTIAPRPRILTENKHIPSQSSSQDPFTCHESSANRSRREPRAVSKGKENEPEVDEEVAAWMGNSNGESGESLAGGEVDLDCVQGLLSLRRGLWR